MNRYANKSRESKNSSEAERTSHDKRSGKSLPHFVNLRPEAVAQRKLLAVIKNSPKVKQLKAAQEMVNRVVLAKKAINAPITNNSSEVIQRQVDPNLPAGTRVRINYGGHQGFETTIISEVRGIGYWVHQRFGRRRYSYSELDPIAANPVVLEDQREPEDGHHEVPAGGEVEHHDVERHEEEIPAADPDIVVGPPEEVLEELVEDVREAEQNEPELGADVEREAEPLAPLAAEAPRPGADPFPAGEHPIETWDTTKSYHRATDRALVPFLTRWRSDAVPRGIGRPVPLNVAIRHLEDHRRYFSHEIPRAYIPFAISQGGIQSGYRTTRALNARAPRRDSGRPQHAFVFTRQLPPAAVRSTISDGQVGAGADAMVVFKPSMFEIARQLALFKGHDGGFVGHTAPSHAYKGAHIVTKSDEVERSTDRHFHANQEQGVLNNIALRHIAIIVLKENTNNPHELAARKAAFIARLRATPISSFMPPSAVRRVIRRNPAAYAAWQAQTEGSLYDLLARATGRRPEDIIRAVPTDTQRFALRDIAHDALHPPEEQE